MRAVLAILAASLLASAAQAEPDRATRLRCAAAFMIIGNEQSRGIPSAKAYPAMEPRGRYYFESVMGAEAQERNLDKDGYRALAKEQVESLQMESIKASDPAKFVKGLMKLCLPILDAKFPPQ
jgi:hypothetical protein